MMLAGQPFHGCPEAARSSARSYLFAPDLDALIVPWTVVTDRAVGEVEAEVMRIGAPSLIVHPIGIGAFAFRVGIAIADFARPPIWYRGYRLWLGPNGDGLWAVAAAANRDHAPAFCLSAGRMHPQVFPFGFPDEIGMCQADAAIHRIMGGEA
ncbi:MAG TPA: hypothetical protein VKQ27_19020 [Acetobacteraceae bacterium]|nr:hypothetical protein [Acetobacteraceae bacterium]